MPHPEPSWSNKFTVAFSGLATAFRTQSSLRFHVIITVCVVSLMMWLRVSLSHAALLLAMIGLVITTELLNTSIEWLVAKLHPEWDPKIGDVLDVAAAAVLIAAITAVAVGLLILGPPLWTVIESMVSKSGR